MYRNYWFFMQNKQFNDMVFWSNRKIQNINKADAMRYLGDFHNKVQTQMNEEKEKQIKLWKDKYDAKEQSFRNEIKALNQQIDRFLLQVAEKDLKISDLESVITQQNNQKDMIANQLADREHEIDLLKTDIQKMQDSLQEHIKSSNLLLQDMQDEINEEKITFVNNIYNEIVGNNNFEIVEDSSLTLECPEDIKLIKILKHFKLPKLNKLKVIPWETDCQDIKQLLTQSFPDEVNYFTFKAWNGGVQSISGYMEELKQCILKSKDKVAIVNSTLNSAELNQIFRTCKHVSRLWIWSCKIEIDSELDFGQENDYNIKYLCFRYTGNYDRTNWESNKSDMQTLFKAISNSGLRRSLNEINVYGCRIAVEEVEEAMNSAFHPDEMQIQNEISISSDNAKPA